MNVELGKKVIQNCIFNKKCKLPARIEDKLKDYLPKTTIFPKFLAFQSHELSQHDVKEHTGSKQPEISD